MDVRASHFVAESCWVEKGTIHMNANVNIHFITVKIE